MNLFNVGKAEIQEISIQTKKFHQGEITREQSGGGRRSAGLAMKGAWRMGHS